MSSRNEPGPGEGRRQASRPGFRGPALLCLSLCLLCCCRGPLPVAPAEGTVLFWLDGKAPPPLEEPAGASRPAPAEPLAGPAPLDSQEVRERRRAVREALGRARNVSELPADLQPLGRARTRIARGELDAAAVELKDRLVQEPTDFAARVQLGDLRIRQRLFGEAVALLEESLRLAPGDPEGSLTLAKALAARRGPGDLDRAAAILEGLVGEELVGPSEVAHARVTVLHFGRKWETAAQVARDAVAAAPQDSILRLDLAQSLLLSGRPEDALAALEPLIAPPLGPEPEALWLEAGILRRLGRYQEAWTRLEALRAPAFEAFRARVFPPVETVAEQVAAEARQGRRLAYLPGEMEEILVTDPVERRRLEVLHVLETAEALPPDPWSVLGRALEDASLEVRIAALRVIGLRLLDQEQAWETLLGCLAAPEGRLRAQAALRLHRPLVDPDPRVRAMAAALFTPARRQTLLAALAEALEREQEGAAFESLHGALQALTGRRIPLLEGEEDDPEARARLKARWKEVLGG